jgi:hypothetical protein
MNKEVSKCYRAIESAKKRLISKANNKGYLWENFGQDEVSKLKDKFGWNCDLSHDDNMEILSALHEFNDWCCNFDFSMIT